MRKLVLYIMMAACSACASSTGSDQEPLQFQMRANIGKVAYNATNGMELGKIVGVTTTDSLGYKGQQPNTWVYRIQRGDSLMTSPAANVSVK